MRLLVKQNVKQTSRSSGSQDKVIALAMVNGGRDFSVLAIALWIVLSLHGAVLRGQGR